MRELWRRWQVRSHRFPTVPRRRPGPRLRRGQSSRWLGRLAAIQAATSSRLQMRIRPLPTTSIGSGKPGRRTISTALVLDTPPSIVAMSARATSFTT